MPSLQKTRRILSLWLPRAMAEHALRRRRGARLPTPPLALAILAEERGALRVASLSPAAEQAGLSIGQSAADARAILPDLVTEMADASARSALLAALLRWAQRFCPWVAEDRSDEASPFGARSQAASGVEEDAAPGRFRGDLSLALDITGSAHLFGGEAALLTRLQEDLARFGFGAQAASAESRGAAWAMARFAPPSQTTAPAGRRAENGARRSGLLVVPAGGARAALGPLPPEALRLEPKAAASLARLGVSDIETLAGLPRGAVSRRFGPGTLRRLDQALGSEPEPIAPRAPPAPYAVRLSLPEPIGLLADLEAALDRLLARLCARLEREGLGARRLILDLRRVDRSALRAETALARPGRDPAAIARLFFRRLEKLDAGFGIDAIRLEAVWVERLALRQSVAGEAAASDNGRAGDPQEALSALLTTLGGRLGFDRLIRLAPASSHLPDRAALTLSAAYAEASADWPAAAAARPPRPLSAFAPEPISPPPAMAPPGPPDRFRWRGALHEIAAAAGPERIAPEWWLDDPAWRSGVRDYWRVETVGGLRLWLFETPESGDGRARWFVAGRFA